MYRFMSLVVSASLLSFGAYAECSSCKSDCIKSESVSDILIEDETNYNLRDGVTLGSKEAEHSIVFYTDAECSFCHKAYQNLQELREKWKDKLNIIVKQSPLNHHQVAKEVARYTLALKNQSEPLAVRFTEYLYENPKAVKAGQDHWLEIAQEFQVDLARLKLDLESPIIEQKLAAEIEGARTLGLRATPSFIIDGKLITGNRSADELEAYMLADSTR